MFFVLGPRGDPIRTGVMFHAYVQHNRSGFGQLSLLVSISSSSLVCSFQACRYIQSLTGFSYGF